MDENLTPTSRHVGGCNMKDTTNDVTDEDWRILRHKIQAFHDHVKGFQKDLERMLTSGR